MKQLFLVFFLLVQYFSVPASQALGSGSAYHSFVFSSSSSSSSSAAVPSISATYENRHLHGFSSNALIEFVEGSEENEEHRDTPAVVDWLPASGTWFTTVFLIPPVNPINLQKLNLCIYRVNRNFRL